MMKNMMSHEENRRIALVNELNAAGGWITLNELTNKIAVSERTLKRDLIYLKECYSDHFFLSSNKGVLLDLPNNLGIDFILRDMFKKSTAFRFIELLFRENELSKCDIETRLFISSSTASRLSIKIKNELEKRGLTLLAKPYRIAGSSQSVRIFFYLYFSEVYSSYEWPYDMVDEKALEKFILSVDSQKKFNLDFVNLTELKHWLAVGLVLQKQEYRRAKNSRAVEDDMQDTMADKKTVASLFGELGLPFSKGTIDQLFGIFLDNRFANQYKELFIRLKRNDASLNDLNQIKDALKIFSKRIGISVPDQEELLLHLFNILFLFDYSKNSLKCFDFVLFNHTERFVQKLYDDFPIFEKAAKQFLFQIELLMGVRLEEFFSNALIYTLVVHWDNFITNISREKRKVRILIFSHFGVEHGRILKDLLEIELHEKVAIELYSESSQSIDALEQDRFDLLIVTRSFTDQIKKLPVVCVNSLPAQEDLNSIRKIVLKVEQQQKQRSF